MASNKSLLETRYLITQVTLPELKVKQKINFKFESQNTLLALTLNNPSDNSPQKLLTFYYSSNTLLLPYE